MSIVNLNKTRTPTIVALTPNEKINGWFIGPDFIIVGLVSDVSLSAGEWTHLTAVMDTSVGFTWYINGIKDNFYDLTRKQARQQLDTDCHTVFIGAKNIDLHYPVNAVLDELKYWYKSLKAEGEWDLRVVVICFNADLCIF